MGMLEYLITVFVERTPWERWLFPEPAPTLHLQKLLERQQAAQATNPEPLLLTQGTAISTAPEFQEANSLEYQYDLLLDDLQHLETEHLPAQGRIGGLPCDCIAKAGRDLRRHARETIPIAAREELDASIFASMAAEGEQLIGIGTSDKVSSGQFDQIYLTHAGTISTLRKELEKMRRGTTSPKANPSNPEVTMREAALRMTQKEYADSHVTNWGKGGEEMRGRFESDHYRFVRRAVSEGKPVPAEVLKDYPDLQTLTPEPALDCPRCEKIKRIKSALENEAGGTGKGKA